MHTTLDRFGRVLLPKPLREEMGIEAGDTLDVETLDGELRLRPARGEPHLVERDGVLVFTGKAAGDVPGVVEQVRGRRLRRASGRLR